MLGVNGSWYASMSRGNWSVNLSIQREAFPWHLNSPQLHMYMPEGSLPEAVLLLVKFTVEREAVCPYWNKPMNGLCLLQEVMVYTFWLMKWPQKLWGILSSPWRDGQCLLVSAIHMWSNSMHVIIIVKSKFSPPLLYFGSDWIFVNPINSFFPLRLEMSRSPKCFSMSQWVLWG